MPTHQSLPDRETLAKVLMFRYMKEGELGRFVSEATIQTHEDGDKIIREGDVDPSLYIVLEGSVSVHVRESSGNEVYVSAIGEGEIFGEAGIFLNVRRTADIVSMGETTILRIPRDELLEFIRTSPSTGIKILMIIIYSLLKKLRESNQELAYERKSVVGQDDIDAIVASVMSGE